MELFVGLFVFNIVFSLFCKTTTSTAISRYRCAHPWKSDFGLANNTAQITERSFSGLQNMITVFLSGQVKDETMKDHLAKCATSPDCRLSTIIDKKKKDVMYVCIEIFESEICYSSNCTCHTKHHKRSINSPFVNKNRNRDQGTIGHRGNLEPNCEFTQSDMKYHHDETVSSSCQNITCTAVDSSIGLDGDTTTAKERHVYNNTKNKETNTGIYILCFFGGALFGIFLGVGVTQAYFKRKSKQTKVLSVRNMVYKQSTTSDEDITFKQIAEYSEIPDSHSNIEVEDALPPGKNIRIADEQGREGSEIRQYVNVQTLPFMIEQEDLCKPSFEENSYPQQIMKDFISGAYLEPTTHHYHMPSQVNSNLEVIEKSAVKDDLKEKEENRHDNGKDVVNQSDVQDENALVHQYNILSKCSSVNRGIYLPQERKNGTSDLCDLKKESSAKEPAYFVLSAIEDPASTSITRKDADIVPNISRAEFLPQEEHHSCDKSGSGNTTERFFSNTDTYYSLQK